MNSGASTSTGIPEPSKHQSQSDRSKIRASRRTSGHRGGASPGRGIGGRIGGSGELNLGGLGAVASTQPHARLRLDFHDMRGALPLAELNDNRTTAGRMQGGLYVVDLELVRAAWTPRGPNGPRVAVVAFAEEGGPAMVPAPRIRVQAGTPVRLTVRNTTDENLDDRSRLPASGGLSGGIDVGAGGSVTVEWTPEADGVYQMVVRTIPYPLDRGIGETPAQTLASAVGEVSESAVRTSHQGYNSGAPGALVFGGLGLFVLSVRVGLGFLARRLSRRRTPPSPRNVA